MSETLFTRGTADRGYGYRKSVNAFGDQGRQGGSALQRFLQNQFDDTFHGAGLRAIGRAIGATYNALDQSTAGAVPGLQSANVTAAALRGGVSAADARQMGETAGQAAAAQQEETRRQTGMTPGLLQQTLGGVEYAWSNYVARPASTALLATDPDAPVYDDGFQLQDIRDSWDRSETVSFGRAFAASPLNEVITPMNPLGAVARIAGFDNYDVWSDTDMEAADENPYYNFFTGTADAALQVVPLPLRPARLSMLRKAGVRSQRGILTADDLVTLRTEYNEHRAWVASQTPEAQEQAAARPLVEVDTDGTPQVTEPVGRETGIGFLVYQVAQSNNQMEILESPLLAGVNGVDKVKLTNVYARTDDPDTVFTLYMAGKGEAQALQDLYERAPEHLWNLGEMNSVMYNNYLDGIYLEPPPGPQLNMVNQIFDSPLERDRYFLDVRRTFIDEESGMSRMGDMTMANSLWVEKIRDVNGQVRYVFKTGDYTGTPQWVRKIVESPLGGPTTQFIAWVGARQPLGRVSRSGARPNDIIEELNAYFSQIGMFRGPKNQLKIGTDRDGNPTYVPAQQFVAEQKARLLQAQVDGNLEGAWREMENETIIVMGLTLGYDARAAADLINKADELRGEAQAVTDYLQKTGGYLFAEDQRLIYDSAATLSMLLDTFATTSLKDVYYYAKQNLPERSKAGKFGTWVPRGSADVFDRIMKFFRTNVLLDVGYIPKNSIGEPWAASFIAHGTVITREGLPATLGNFQKNRVNNLRRAAYASELDTRIKKLFGAKNAKTSKELRLEIKALIIQREDALATMDLMQADLDAIKRGEVSPSKSPVVAARARTTMFEAHKIIRSIEASLDETIPEWRQVVEPATVAQVSERLRFYRAVLGEDPDFLNDLRDELGSIYTAAYERTTLPSQRLGKQIEDINAQIAELDKTLEQLEIDFRNPDIDVADVAVTRAGAQRDWANAKINRDFLQAQLRDAKRANVDLTQPTAEVDAAIMQYRAKALLEEDPDLAVEATPDGIYVINFGDLPTYQKYMSKYYGSLDNYSMISLYRRVATDQDMFAADGSWSLSPVSVAGSGQLVSIDMPLNQLTQLSKGRRQFVPGRDQFVDLVSSRIPAEYRRSVKRLGDPAVPAGTDDYAAWDMLAKRNPGQVADEARFEGNTARGRDYRAIAMQRQRRSLIEQRDEMIDEKRRIDDTGVDAFADFKMSVSEKARSDYLEQQIARLENLREADSADKIRPLLAELEEQYEAYLRNVDREVDVSAEKRDAMIRRVEELDEKLKALQTQLGFKEAKLDSVRGDRVQFGSGRGTMTFNIGGEKFTVPGSLSDDQYALGAGWRSEVSAAQTTRMNYDPSFKAGSLTSRLRDAGDVEVIDRFDPRYFDELAYVSNVHFRDDQLIGQILEGKTKAQVAAWLRTPKGRQYQQALGKDYLTNVEVRTDPMPALNGEQSVRVLLESASTLDEIWNIVYAYLPTDRVRKFVADRRKTGDFPVQGRNVGVTGSELKALLAGEENLSRILSARGIWDTLGNANNKLREAGSVADRALDNLWGLAMTKPETLLARNPFFDREVYRQMRVRIRVLEEQAKQNNVRMTVDQWNAQLDGMLQSARRDALAEMEKTFYNIRRYSTPVYAARFLTAFPGAVFNSLYRYGRFAWREPERMLVGALALGDAISVLGVDAEGNPVGEENIADAVYLLVPGTKKSQEDSGMTIPIGSIATMFVDLPQLSWLGNFLVSDIVARNPKNDQRFRDIFDSVGLGWYYDDLFPYGPPANPLSTFFGPYQKELNRWYRGLSDTDFIMSTVQFYADSMANWEKGGFQGEAPTFDQAVDDAHAYYFAEAIQFGPIKLPTSINFDSRTITKFFSPVSIKQSPPGQMMRDAWYRHREQYPNDTAEARRTFMEKHGPQARWYTYSTSEYVTYMPSSQDVYDRVWVKYPNLIREMVSVAGDDAIQYVNLIALDADQTFDSTVNNYMRNNALPGDDVPVLRRIQPERFANIVRVNDGWDLYSREVVKYEAELTRLREMRDSTDSPEMKDFYRDEIYRTEQSWTEWVDNGPLSENTPWQVSRSERGQNKADNAATFLSMIVNDPKFAQDEGRTKFWQNVKFFIDERNRAKAELSRIRDDDDKYAYKARFRTWARNEFMPYAPEFLPTFERYFESEWE